MNLGSDEERILRQDTTIYVVGSGGRGEMSEHSDVDIFVARTHRASSDLDAFQLRQAIARAFYDRKLPEPSQGGEFLKMHTAHTPCERMGTPEDDGSNTFTARMLLLLESRPLLGEQAYLDLIATRKSRSCRLPSTGIEPSRDNALSLPLEKMRQGEINPIFFGSGDFVAETAHPRATSCTSKERPNFNCVRSPPGHPEGAT